MFSGACILNKFQLLRIRDIAGGQGTKGKIIADRTKKVIL
jgi:hypothetical protein